MNWCCSKDVLNKIWKTQVLGEFATLAPLIRVKWAFVSNWPCVIKTADLSSFGEWFSLRDSCLHYIFLREDFSIVYSFLSAKHLHCWVWVYVVLPVPGNWWNNSVKWRTAGSPVLNDHQRDVLCCLAYNVSSLLAVVISDATSKICAHNKIGSHFMEM